VKLLERFGPPRRLTIDSEAALGGEHARRACRSWWSLRYVDGTIIHEWDRDPGSPNGHADWPRLAMLGKLKRTQALRLYCPNGRMAEVGGEGDQTGRLFQFKVAVRYSSVGAAVAGQDVLAHVIGIVTGLDGQCTLLSWEPHPEPARPNAADFNGAPPGVLADAYDAWRKLHNTWRAMGGGQLVGPISDSVYDLKYQHVGRLHADHLGLTDGEGR
jgi:hypothetical protein